MKEFYLETVIYFLEKNQAEILKLKENIIQKIKNLMDGSIVD